MGRSGPSDLGILGLAGQPLPRGQPGGDSALHIHQGAADDSLHCWLVEGGAACVPARAYHLGSLDRQGGRSRTVRTEAPFLPRELPVGETLAFMGHHE